MCLNSWKDNILPPKLTQAFHWSFWYSVAVNGNISFDFYSSLLPHFIATFHNSWNDPATFWRVWILDDYCFVFLNLICFYSSFSGLIFFHLHDYCRREFNKCFCYDSKKKLNLETQTVCQKVCKIFSWYCIKGSLLQLHCFSTQSFIAGKKENSPIVEKKILLQSERKLYEGELVILNWKLDDTFCVQK